MGALLDVSISVLAVMILFSLAAGAISEMIANNIMRLHGRTLERAMFLMMRAVFAMGYRSFEWKCNPLDAAFARWLNPSNFDADGRLRLRLSTLTRLLLANEG